MWNAAQPGSNRWLVGEVHRRRIGPERSAAIVALADGGVVEVGSHDQLMAAKGFGHDRFMSRFRSGAAPAGDDSG